MADPGGKKEKAVQQTKPVEAAPSGDDADGVESIEALIENLPEDKREQVQKLVIQESFGMMGIGRYNPENELAKKINETHITNYLDGAREQMQNDYKEKHEKKIFTVVLVALALIFFTAIIVLLKDNPDVLEKIIYSVGGVIVGAFGGYGFGRQKRDDDD